jgi:hypothetical protein
MKAGAMTSRNKIIGSGTITASGNRGFQILASLTGSGTISNALADLLVALVASISGSGTISDADMKAYLDLVADITGNGDITEAELLAVGELIAALLGEGELTATLLGNGALSADITSYGSLTPEGLRDAVWGAIAANYNVSGTMGQKLNSAAVGGVDYQALAEAVWDSEVSGRTSAQAGKIMEDIKAKTNLIPGLF